MPRLHVEHVARADLDLRAVVADDLHAARDHVADVMHLAALGSLERLDVVRPAPAWLERAEPHGARGELDELDLTVVDELADLFG